jgi:pimeloyl-ACP methyl ester carboxylesterase
MKQEFQNRFLDFRHIYIDLIGFGDSYDTPFPLNSEDYKNILEILLSTLQISKDIVVGHSFGGKIATLLKPHQLILLSSAGIVPKKSLKVKSKILFSKLMKVLGISSFGKLFVSKDGKNLSKNMYETFKNVIDEDFVETFQNCRAETTIFWGKDDLATPLASGKEIHQLITNSKLFIQNGDHFFFLGQGSFIEKNIKA